MLITEFIERTGFRPNDNFYYTMIEVEYAHSPLEKDEFCAKWKRDNKYLLDLLKSFEGALKALDKLRAKKENAFNKMLWWDTERHIALSTIARMSKEATPYAYEEEGNKLDNTRKMCDRYNNEVNDIEAQIAILERTKENIYTTLIEAGWMPL